MTSSQIGADLALLQGTAREFARLELRPRGRTAEEAGRAPPEVARRHRELGLAAVELEPSLGGLGLGLFGRVIAEEELAWGDLPLALAMPGPAGFAQAVRLFGSASQQSKLLIPLAQQGRRGVVAWSEPGPPAAALATLAEEQADGSWRLSGRKSRLLAGAEASAAVVFARARFRSGDERTAAFALVLAGGASSGGAVGFSVPAGGLGLRAAPAAELVLDGARVDAGARLAAADLAFDAAVLELFLRMGTVGAAREVGLARAALEVARAHARERHAFGRPLAQHQGLGFLLAEMAIRVEAMRALVRSAASALDRRDPAAKKLAAMAIAEGHEGALFVATRAVQVLGGAGYTEDHLVEKWMRDAQAHRSHALTAQAADLLVGRLGLEGAPEALEAAPLVEVQQVLT